MHVCVCVFISVRLSAPSDPVDTHGRVDSGLDLDALRAERGVTPSWVSEGSFTLVGEAWYLGHKAKATEPREFLLGGKRGVNVKGDCWEGAKTRAELQDQKELQGDGKSEERSFIGARERNPAWENDGAPFPDLGPL